MTSEKPRNRKPALPVAQSEPPPTPEAIRRMDPEGLEELLEDLKKKRDRDGLYHCTNRMQAIILSNEASDKRKSTFHWYIQFRGAVDKLEYGHPILLQPFGSMVRRRIECIQGERCR